jgi:hypothetical protein
MRRLSGARKRITLGGVWEGLLTVVFSFLWVGVPMLLSWGFVALLAYWFG